MPKVTENYKKEKKELIIKAAIEILHEKSLYEMSMLDVVKQAQISKGGIYIYFSDIDELLVETINKITSFQDEISFLEESLKNDIEVDLIENFQRLGDYIDSCPTIVSKIRSELMVYITNNPDKMDKIMPKLELKKVGTQFMSLITVLIERGIEQELFRKEINLEIVMHNISAYVDGITDIVVRSKVYNGTKLSYPTKIYFNQFIQGVILSLK